MLAPYKYLLGLLYIYNTMARKKQEYEKKMFESNRQPNDTSANIYMSMLTSENWKKLSKNAQVLYLYCKAQYYAEKKKPKPIIVNLTESEQRQCFTMNKSKWHGLYSLYTNASQFYKDMKMLVEFGFIKVVECGRISRTKNIYAFSSEWQK